MTNILARIATMENKINTVRADSYQLRRVIVVDGDHTFFVDGVKVDRRDYLILEAAQIATMQARSGARFFDVAIVEDK